jgi:hypothetical protein
MYLFILLKKKITNGKEAKNNQTSSIDISVPQSTVDNVSNITLALSPGSTIGYNDLHLANPPIMTLFSRHVQGEIGFFVF